MNHRCISGRNWFPDYIDEPYRNHGGGAISTIDRTGQTALWAYVEQVFQEIVKHSKKTSSERRRKEFSFTCNCYAPTSAALAEYEQCSVGNICGARCDTHKCWDLIHFQEKRPGFSSGPEIRGHRFSQ